MRLRKLLFSLCTLSLLVLQPLAQASEVQPATPLYSGITAAGLAHRQPIHWVSVAQIENNLRGRPPMAVGFDIDDTVLYSTPGFYRGQKMFSPGNNDYLNNPQFWEKMNNGWDEFSIPKQVARQLIQMHLQRGDQVYFITARTPTSTETVSRILQQDFSIPQDKMNPVIFSGFRAGENTKIRWIKQKNIRIYYGDADSDITAAREAGARGIRVLRAANSSYLPLPKAGDLGEEVITDSEY
ncbi:MULTISPECIES: acid phosphatase AphA [Tatumella]|uniref:Class B acid phosphatase n=1 Tax=Tatumella punctata TaxID=399969 RepID=A0ABW1VQ80_9GAMM|nr:MULTISPECIES: acid phosphatase AphA [unclassified Tatumella]MBS0857164.1 acid phosphatase AphA [Tatumella sp. JGM16]MBS0878531.1 acid phosphatase AphA [Tatumella sp. JGM82]MBS0892123.1 acid phosphatase AphA [Tatumella sp. JGM94]MBS0894022.1 acid phosphatase AphA [Tatumella sp. JGM130]MBS0903222.1 acid phosphatase AphA [Tatumella sp. JGM100]